MPRTIQIPGVGNIQFPDEMSNDDIASAIKTKIVPQRMQSLYADKSMPAVQKIQQLDQLDPDFKGLSMNDKVTRIMGAMQPGMMQQANAPATWGQRGLELSKGLLQAVPSDVAHGADIVTRNLGLPSPLSSDYVKSIITPEDTWAGQAGFDIGEMLPYFAEAPGEALLKGPGLLRAGARTLLEAGKAGTISGIQTGTKEGAETGAILGGGLAGLGEILRGAGGLAYRRALKPGKTLPAAERKAMVERGVGGGLPINQTSRAKLDAEVNMFKGMLNKLMADPVYGNRSIPVANLIRPVNELIARVQPASQVLADAIRAERDHWITSLGGGSRTTAAAAQTLKEALDAVLSPGAFMKAHLPPGQAGYRMTREAIKEGIEQAIPDRIQQWGGRTVHDINQVMHIDLRLKQAMKAAMERDPEWYHRALPFVLGGAAGAAWGGFTGEGHRGMSATVDAALGAMLAAASRNPAIMSRLGIALRRAGVAPLAVLTPAIREQSGVPKAAAPAPTRRQTSPAAPRQQTSPTVPSPQEAPAPAEGDTGEEYLPPEEEPEARATPPPAEPAMPEPTSAPEVAEAEPDNLPQVSRPYGRQSFTPTPTTTEGGAAPQPLLEADAWRRMEAGQREALRRFPQTLPLPGAPASPYETRLRPTETARRGTAAAAPRREIAGAMPRGDDLVDSMAQAITRIEGDRTKDRNQRNNNPGNLRPVGFTYRGQIDTDPGGFAIFKDRAAGERALKMQIRINLKRGLTLKEFFAGKKGVYSGYAPKKDRNLPEKYASDVAKMVGIADTDMPLSL